MAATKKALAIRAEKDAIRNEIQQLNEQLKQSASRVPSNVLNGSYQQVVEWKAEAERTFFGVLAAGAKKCTLDELHSLRAAKMHQLNRLQGAA